MTRHRHRRTLKPLIACKVTSKGTAHRRIIGKLVAAGRSRRREYLLHATKGYRSYLVAP